MSRHVLSSVVRSIRMDTCPSVPKPVRIAVGSELTGERGNEPSKIASCRPGKLSMYTEGLRVLNQCEIRSDQTAARYNLKRLLERAELPK